jgi:hypothetical protein
MTHRVSRIGMLSFALVAILGLTTLFAQNAGSPELQAAQKAYAAAILDLAETRLNQLNREREVARDAVPDETIAILEAQAELAKQQLDQVTNGKPVDILEFQISEAAAELQARDTNYQKLTRIREFAATSAAVSASDLKIAAAQTAVARSRVAILKALASQPAEVRMQWQIADLQNQISSLWARPQIED